MNRFTLLFQNNGLENEYFSYFKSQIHSSFTIILIAVTPFNIYLGIIAMRKDNLIEFIFRMSTVVIYLLMIPISKRTRFLFIVCTLIFQLLFSMLSAIFSLQYALSNSLDAFWMGFAISQVHTLLKGLHWVVDSISYFSIFVIYTIIAVRLGGFSLFIVSSGIFILLNMVNSYKTSFFARTSFLSRVENLEQRRLWDFIMKEVFFGSMVLLKPWNFKNNSKVLFKSTTSFKLRTMKIGDNKKGTFFQSYPKQEEISPQFKSPIFEIEEISERFQEIYGSDRYEEIETLFSQVDLEGSSCTMHQDTSSPMTLLKWVENQAQEIKCCKDFSKNLIKEKLIATIKGKKMEINASIFIWRKEYHILLQFSTDEYYKDELNSMKKLDKYKDRFLASITHDLRTPLFGVEVMIDSALAEPNEQDRNNFLQIAKINSKLLMNLVGDILDYSQFRESKFRINLSSFSLYTILEEVGSLMKIQADMRNITLRIRNFCSEDCELHSDSKRIKQVLINLISNSLKFTEIGTVELRVSNPGENLLKFEVIDTGHGIPEKDIPNLSQPYNTKDTEKGINKEGIGLGLYNCKNIVSYLGPYEKLFVSSKLGLGTKFGFIIFQSMLLNQHKARLSSSPPSNLPGKMKKAKGLSSKEAGDYQKSVFGIKKAEYSFRTNLSINNNKAAAGSNLNDKFVLEINNDIEKPEAPNIEDQFSTFMSFIEDEDQKDYAREKEDFSANENLKKNFPSFTDSISDNMTSSLFSLFPKKTEPVSSTFKRPNAQNQSKTKIFGVLIVDDNPFNLLILNKFLNKVENYQILVEKATNGKMALDFFKERNRSCSHNPFSIIYMDCMMPIMDGYEATKEIRSMIRKGYKDVQIIGFTSLAGDEEKDLSMKAGMDDLLLKPSTEQEIIELTQKILQSRPTNVISNL